MPPVHWKQRGQPLQMTLGKTVFDGNGPAFDVSGFGQTAEKSRDNIADLIARSSAQIADHRHLRMLRPRHQRPNRRAAGAPQ